VLFFDSHKNFHAHPNNEIENEGHFLSILDLEFSVEFISEQKIPTSKQTLGVIGQANFCSSPPGQDSQLCIVLTA
jgi:hypothetical protein